MGDNCQTSSCPDDCSGHGTCKSPGGGKGKMCVCDTGYASANCDTCLGSTFCSGHGECSFSEESKKAAAASGYPVTTTCACDAGWNGPVCALSCPSNTTNATCSGAGKCMNLPDTGSTCECARGYKGADCSFPDCMEKCVHGKCAPVAPDGGLACDCVQGWSGAACDRQVCPSTGKGECNGHGLCVGATCYCRDGFLPPDCVKTSCPNDCSNAGVCNPGGKCACDPGRAGPDCHERVCMPVDCSGHGSCLGGRCHCEKGWLPNDCGTPVPIRSLLSKPKKKEVPPPPIVHPALLIASKSYDGSAADPPAASWPWLPPCTSC